MFDGNRPLSCAGVMIFLIRNWNICMGTYLKAIDIRVFRTTTEGLIHVG